MQTQGSEADAKILWEENKQFIDHLLDMNRSYGEAWKILQDAGFEWEAVMERVANEANDGERVGDEIESTFEYTIEDTGWLYES